MRIQSIDEDLVRRYITPEAVCIKNLSRELGLHNKTKNEVLRSVWGYVNDLGYVEQSRWFKPCRTVEKGYGDCTDYSLLISSLLANRGVEHKIVFGYYYDMDGNPRPHAWIEVDGEVLETTNVLGHYLQKNYKEVKTYRVRKVNGNEVKRNGV